MKYRNILSIIIPTIENDIELLNKVSSIRNSQFGDKLEICLSLNSGQPFTYHERNSIKLVNKYIKNEKKINVFDNFLNALLLAESKYAVISPVDDHLDVEKLFLFFADLDDEFSEIFFVTHKLRYQNETIEKYEKYKLENNLNLISNWLINPFDLIAYFPARTTTLIEIMKRSKKYIARFIPEKFHGNRVCFPLTLWAICKYKIRVVDIEDLLKINIFFGENKINRDYINSLLMDTQCCLSIFKILVLQIYKSFISPRYKKVKGTKKILYVFENLLKSIIIIKHFIFFCLKRISTGFMQSY